MCRALMESLHQAGHSPVACLLPELAHQCCCESIHAVNLACDIRSQWRSVYRQCDATLIVAPESDGLLNELEQWGQSSAIRTCGCDASFIAHASDKWKVARRWQARGVPHPHTQLIGDWYSATGTWVIKSRDGCGCEGMHIATASELRSMQTDGRDGDSWIVQPWVTGQAFSRSVIIDKLGQYHWLPVVSQTLSIDNAVTYQGGRVLPEEALSPTQAEHLELAIRSLDGQPCGWVGVDFLIDQQGQLVVIEVNPRLTTSFVGLSKACEVSLAECILNAAIGKPIHLPTSWRSVTFSAKG